MPRLPFVYLFAAGVLALAASGYHVPSKSPDSPFSSKRSIEWALNQGYCDLASRLLSEASQLEVLISKAVSDELNASFNHDHEVLYFLFADHRGIISYAARPPQQAGRGEREHIFARLYQEWFQEQESRGVHLVGDFHTHPGTSTWVARHAFEQQHSVEELRRTHPDHLSWRYANTEPSDNDLPSYFMQSTDPHSPSYRFSRYLKDHASIHLIAGLNSDTLHYELRAFMYLDTGKGTAAMTLNTKGEQCWEEIDNYHRIRQRRPLQFLELKPRIVD